MCDVVFGVVWCVCRMHRVYVHVSLLCAVVYNVHVHVSLLCVLVRSVCAFACRRVLLSVAPLSFVFTLCVCRSPIFLVSQVVSISFSSDDTVLLLQGGAPDWLLSCWLWEKGKVRRPPHHANSVLPWCAPRVVGVVPRSLRMHVLVSPVFPELLAVQWCTAASALTLFLSCPPFCANRRS